MPCEPMERTRTAPAPKPPAALAAAESLPAEALLTAAFAHWGRALVLCTALQSEGLVLLDLCRRIFPAVRVLTLDTGRLPDETHAFLEQVEGHFGVRIEVIYPDAGELRRLTERQGVNGFRAGQVERELCCQIRKVRPWQAVLAGRWGPAPAAWISGLRREQSPARRRTPKLQPDPETAGAWKLAPLADWSAEQVERYTLRRGLPRHPLYARGYASLGCAPCTRALRPGENERLGRWWWEISSKECGLHRGASPELNLRLQELLPSRKSEAISLA